MGLRDEIKGLSGNRRRFFLLRVADMDTKSALKICGVVRGTYNSWLQNDAFVEIYRRRAEFQEEYKKEAVQLLRRDNQLEAVLLESKILRKMKEDLAQDTLPEGSIVRTNLAKEVYNKLMTDLDASPKEVNLTWEQRLLQIVNPPVPQIPEGGTVDGEFKAVGESETEHQESQPVQES